MPVVVQFIVDHAAREASDEELEAAIAEAGAKDNKNNNKENKDAEGKKASRKKPIRKAASLVFDLPPEIDALLVAQGYKGKTGAYALNTLVHRLAVLSKGPPERPCRQSLQPHAGARAFEKRAQSLRVLRGKLTGGSAQPKAAFSSKDIAPNILAIRRWVDSVICCL